MPSSSAKKSVTLSRMLLLCGLLTFFALGLAGQLFVFKYRNAIDDVREARMTLIGGELRQIIEKGAAIGLMPVDSPSLREAVHSRRMADPLIRRIQIADPTGGTIVSEGNASPIEGEKQVSLDAKNSFDLTLGRVIVVYDGNPLREQTQVFGIRMLLVGIALALLATGLGAVGVMALRRRGHSDQFSLVGVLPWLAAGVLVLGGMTYQRLQTDMNPEFVAQAEAVGRSAVSLIARATDFGVPLEKMPGVEAYFDGLRKTTPAFAAISVMVNGKVLYRSGTDLDGKEVKLPIKTREGEAGALSLRMVIDPRAVQRVLTAMVLDLATIIVVSGFLAIELFRFLFTPTVRMDADDDGGRSDWIATLRAPIFLLFLAEDLTRSFLPVFAGQLPLDPEGFLSSALTTLGWHLSTKAMAGLPVIVFMLLVALAQPFTSTIVNRFGVRQILLSAALASALSHFWAASATSADALLASRILAALAWALAFATAQAVILYSTGRKYRAEGMSHLVGIVMSASICGPSVGGILADLSYQGAFFTAMGLSLLAAVLMLRIDTPQSLLALGAAGKPSTRPGSPAASRPPEKTSPFSFMTNRRFAELLLLAAVPAKLILIGFCFYLVPVYIGDWGGTASDAGRIQMVYGIAMVIAGPIFARAAVPGRQARQVALGLVVSGLSGLALLWPSLGMAALMALLLGIGQSIGIAAQAALVGEVCAREITARGDAEVYGIYRLLERMGNTLGPAAAAALAGLLGASGAFATLGAGVVASGLLFGFLFGVHARRETT